MNAHGYCIQESMAGADYLLQQNVPAAQVLRESSSYDTVGNAYFAATIHAWPLQWRHLAVVTSAFHMPRSRAIFEHVFKLLDHSARWERQCAPT